VQKWLIIPIVQGPISRLCPLLTPNFICQPERTGNAKGTDSKRVEKKERGKKKNSNWAVAKIP